MHSSHRPTNFDKSGSGDKRKEDKDRDVAEGFESREWNPNPERGARLWERASFRSAYHMYYTSSPELVPILGRFVEPRVVKIEKCEM